MTSDAAKLNQLVWLGAAFIAVGLLGFFLASDAYFAFFVTLALLLIGTLPYHSKLAVYLSVATFSSAIIIPFAPGRPYLWEFAAMLAWSGLLVTVAMRRYKEDYFNSIRDNKWLFIGLLGYIGMLVFTMYARGVGLRITGGGQMGGRFYFQQMICGIFPLTFAMVRPREKTMVTLLILQYLLSFTFLVSELVFMFAPRELQVVLQFLDVSGDSFTFEKQASNFGFLRMASLLVVGEAMVFLLIAFHKLSDFLSVRGLYLIPISAGVLFMGMLSGHRIILVDVFGVILILAYAQRMFTPRSVMISGMGLSFFLLIIYMFADQMPMAVQRAVSILPGLDVQQAAYDDAFGTLGTRSMLREIGMEMIPEYFWIGRGFSFSASDNLTMLSDPTGLDLHVAQGRFYNGLIGLMVNTGIFGTLFMMILMLGGSILAWRIIKRVRVLGSDDVFLRLSGIAASFWLANIITFLLLHGDSQYAMKSFSFQAGVLIVVDYHLRMRMLKV